MDTTFTFSLYGIVAVLLIVSCIKSRKKTLLSLKKAWKIFLNVLPQFIAVLLLVGLLLAVVKPETIQRIIGADSGFGGMLLTSLLGSVTLVPVLIAFPIAAELLANGAGVTQIAVFISTLTMVGVVTIPIEIKYLGKKVAILRNVLAYIFAFVTAFVIGAVLR
jgi:uncharacterized membrane protein YraQ (UPF0718 family)